MPLLKKRGGKVKDAYCDELAPLSALMVKSHAVAQLAGLYPPSILYLKRTCLVSARVWCVCVRVGVRGVRVYGVCVRAHANMREGKAE